MTHSVRDGYEEVKWEVEFSFFDLSLNRGIKAGWEFAARIVREKPIAKKIFFKINGGRELF